MTTKTTTEIPPMLECPECGHPLIPATCRGRVDEHGEVIRDESADWIWVTPSGPTRCYRCGATAEVRVDGDDAARTVTVAKAAFVELSLPPGYDYLADPLVTGTCHWVTYREKGPLCKNRFDAYRSAWRHWTAKVLRGRNVRWYFEDDCATAQLRKVVLQDERDKGWDGWGLFIVDDHDGITDVGCIDDLDDAMAQFAALVMAKEGMPR